jgi:ABC-type transporter MlaC component
MRRKLTDQVQLKLRFDENLRRKLERAAAKNDRSMNAEIVRRLEQSLLDEDVLTEIRTNLADMKRTLAETQDQQFERFLKELHEQQLADAQADYRDDPDYRDDKDDEGR